MTETLASLALWQYIVIVVALMLGGLMKGVTGGGAPILAIPVMSSMIDLTMAVIIMLGPNLVTNVRQSIQYRAAAPPRGFLLPYLGAGAVGVVLGAVALVHLPDRPLEVLVALAITGYVAFRVARPSWRLPERMVRPLAAPAGAVAGLLQGATGLSAPATLTFLSASRLSRPSFVATLAMLFLLFSILHIAALAALGSYPPALALLSVVAVLPVLAGMEFGAALAKHISQDLFEKIVLVLLTGIALKLILET